MPVTFVADPARSGFPLGFVSKSAAEKYVTEHPQAGIVTGRISPVFVADAVGYFEWRHRECGPDCCITGDDCDDDSVAF